VRAPHDGLVVYARPSDDGARVMVGASVRQKQDLFYLPDLRHMEVQTVLHETVVPRVRAGMPVWVRVEALSDRTLPGRVVSISPLPLPRSRRSSPDVRNYRARVVLDEAPAALRPGMSAAVAIETNRRPGALVIPRDAVAGVSGRDVCYVAGPRGLERRRVAIGTAERDLLEVTAGLAEGEEVVLVPARPEALAALDSAAIEVEESGGASPSPVVVVGGQTPEFDSTRESTPADERDKPAPGPQAGE
jgi:HlyD family secretion protein